MARKFSFYVWGVREQKKTLGTTEIKDFKKFYIVIFYQDGALSFIRDYEDSTFAKLVVFKTLSSATFFPLNFVALCQLTTFVCYLIRQGLKAATECVRDLWLNKAKTVIFESLLATFEASTIFLRQLGLKKILVWALNHIKITKLSLAKSLIHTVGSIQWKTKHAETEEKLT